MDLLGVVPTQLVLFVGLPVAERNFDIAVGILAADHETDLARGIRWDGCVGVFDDGEDLLAGFLELADEREVQPLVFGYIVGKAEPRGVSLGGRETFWFWERGKRKKKADEGESK